ncbi:peroxidase-like [Pararge aegeria]|uniref:peroxidase-like n=1 Tax=Pararge aegeria TaxID=116150 RepID=UPI0019D0D02F|nr:peroxidase-like [Pararge aegeria]
MILISRYQLFYAFLLTLVTGTATSVLYDSYSGKIITPEQYKGHEKDNTTFWCTNKIQPCNPTEGRRIDGSCNNLKHPTRGASHTPAYHVLPVVFEGYDNPRKSIRGDDLPLSRKVRTTLLLEGRVPDHQITHLVTYFWVFMSADVLSFHDSINYLTWKTHCCEERGKTDPACISITIPDDDPVHRFTSEGCLALTRPFTFQSSGCTGSNHPPERIVISTPTFDLSQLYGDTHEILLKKQSFKGGLLKHETVDGRVWPPSFNSSERFRVCVLNQPPKETRCHDIGEESNNGILGTNLFTIWMWRHHNHLATKLAAINPCWDDERLFYAAREVNIATAMQIFFYELHPTILGKENLIQEGVLSATSGFRDIYNEDVLPQVSLEYGFSLRWTHTIQEGIAKMYDANGNYLQSMRIANLTTRTGYLAVDDHLDQLTQGAFRQAAGNIDSAVDPDMAESGLGPLLRLTDLPASDLQKNRYLGIAPYVQYRKFCFGEVINTFDELVHAIDSEKIELLKELYSDVKDIDLMAGIWVERAISDGRAPATFYCLMVDQLLRTIVSDRHWYERPNRPNAFTIDQLQEIRNASIARLMCDVGDKVTKIQPRAFLIPGPGNEIVSCAKIPRINLEAWTDDQCIFPHVPT